MNMLRQLFFIFHMFIWCLHFIFSLQLRSFKSFLAALVLKQHFVFSQNNFIMNTIVTHFIYNAVDYVVKIMIYPAFIGCSRLLWKHPSTPVTRLYSLWAFWCVLSKVHVRSVHARQIKPGEYGQRNDEAIVQIRIQLQSEGQSKYQIEIPTTEQGI